MGIRFHPHYVLEGTDPRAAFETYGLAPHAWGNGPGDTYDWHGHPYDKVLVCAKGSITFHAGDGDYPMQVGDRLDIDAGTEHAATVGPYGCECLEAAR